VELVELKEKVTMSREEAAARLHAIADELGANNDVVIEREHIRFVAHVPDQVNLKVEFEIEDDGTELEIDLTWYYSKHPKTRATPAMLESALG
jgi:amphi-Trp domain-containing protein